MARPQKQTADYFPHTAVEGKTLFILESRYGVGGYAAWFKLIQLLCRTPGHCYYAVSEADMAFLTAEMRFVTADTTIQFIDMCIMLGALDKDLWDEKRGIWSQHLVDNLADLYRRRKAIVPEKPLPTSDTLLIPSKTPLPPTETDKVNKSKLNKIKDDGPEILGIKIDTKWYNDFISNLSPSYTAKEITNEMAKFTDYWTAGSKRKCKNVKLALRNWFETASRIRNDRASKTGAKALPDTQTLKEKWGQ